jgi:hypothetical protein
MRYIYYLFFITSVIAKTNLRKTVEDLSEGLGGASIDILCSPPQVPLDLSFAINLKYQTQVPRNVDVHVDVLNAITKEWYTGSLVQMDYPVGYVSTNITIPNTAEQPFIYKVFVAPRGEPFPNMLAEKGLAINIGDEIEGACIPFKNNGSQLSTKNYGDYVIITKSCDNNVTTTYNLESNIEATLAFDLMNTSTNMLITSGYSYNIMRGTRNLTTYFNMPEDTNGTYVIATMVPINGNWTERIAEGRTYRVNNCVSST